MDGGWATPLSAYWVKHIIHGDVMDKDISQELKAGAHELEYPEHHDIPIQQVDTYSLCGGGANALSLNDYSNTQI